MAWRVWVIAFAGTVGVGCGGPDSGSPGPATGAVTILVLVGGEPAPGIDVVFHAEEDGGVLEHLVTGSAGTATRIIDRGEAVTVAYLGAFGDRELLTFAGLVPLEDVTVEFRLGFDSPVSAVVDVSVDPFPASQDFVVDHVCGLSFSGDPNGPIELRDECFTPPGTIDIAIDANTPDGEPLAWTSRMDLSVPASGAAVPMPAWRTDFDELTVLVTGSSALGVPGLGFVLAATVLDREVSAGNASRDFLGEPGSFTLPRLPPGERQSLLTMLYVSYSIGGSWYIDLDPAFPDSVSLDMERDLKGPLTVSAPGLGGTERPIVSWSGASASGHDATAVMLWWDTGAEWNEWRIYSRPRASGTLEFPELPDALAAFRPMLTPDQASVSVNQIASSHVSGWGDFRREGHLHSLDWPASGHLQERIWWGGVEYP